MGRRWSGVVGTASTFPPPGLFARDAETIAATMARPDVSPGGLGAAIRMVTYYLNRAGRLLPRARRDELERARRILQRRRRDASTLPPRARAPGTYRHPALGIVEVVRRGRRWVMHRGGAGPPIPIGPDGWMLLDRV